MKEAERERRSRRLRQVAVWLVAVAWTALLVAGDERTDGAFGVAVKAMGSAGLLFALFIVTRPSADADDEQAEADVGRETTGGYRREPSSARARWSIITIALALAFGGFFYRLTQDSYLHQSAVFFIGVPTVLAITLALTPRAKSATGMIMKGLTLALLLSGILFYEGFVCIVMAAPLFYLVGTVVGVPIDRARRRKQSEPRVYSIVGAALLLLSVEGATPFTSFSTHQTVVAVRTVEAPADEVAAVLASTPSFDRDLPFFLELGFPRPVEAHGEGLEVGDRRTIVFGNESPMEPMETRPRSHDHAAPVEDGGGVLELEITRSTEGRVVFVPVSDATAFTHWIAWGRSIVEWAPVEHDTTRVTWTLHFERRLSPAWYFGPLERYAAGLAAGYLIDATATP